jgi:alcohol dehydrogenase, propanol-preferring
MFRTPCTGRRRYHACPQPVIYLFALNIRSVANMRACVLERPAPIAQRPLALQEVDRPQAGPGEALIRVRACGVCRTDLHVIEGELDQNRQKSPVIPGHQVVGEIVEINTSDIKGGPSQSESGVHLRAGDRVGVAWLGRTCGECPFCRSERENLCDAPEFTGLTRDGGYAEYLTASIDFIYPVPDGFEDLQAAPLLCAGIIGFRCLHMTGLSDWSGARLGIYGFGAAGHVAIQIAIARGASVYVCTRDRERHQKLAAELGAEWVGDTVDRPPVELDAGIIFAPAGEIVPAALSHLAKGGRLVCGGIHMSDIPSFPYRDLYGERSITSVTNNTRDDGRAFLEEAARVGVRTHSELFPIEQANDALIALKRDAIRGAAVLVIDQ